MNDPVSERQTTTLINVLKLEAKHGFNNSAVVGGGLDAMLRNLGQIAGRVQNLPPMDGRRYAVLSPEERRAWATAAYRTLSPTRPRADRPDTPTATSESRSEDQRSKTKRDQPRSPAKPAVGLDAPVAFVAFSASIG